jgi:hypothetical protein
VPTTAEEKPYDERDWISTLRSRAWDAYRLGTDDGVRLAHRLILEASRTALAEVCPDQTGGDHAPLHDLQWALADLETGHRRKSLCVPPHTKRRGTKPSPSARLVFKADCIEAARLLIEAGESQWNADAIVLAAVQAVAPEIGVRLKVPTRKRNDSKGQRETTLDFWRRDFLKRRAASMNGSRTLHVSFEPDPKVSTGTKLEKRRQAQALLESLKKTIVSRC